MTGDFITPGDLTARLGVSDRTTRRLADAYSKVYGLLPRVSPASSNRLFPVVAVERITAAHQLMRDVPGMSAVDAFKAQRDGVTIPRREERAPDADALAPVMAELRALRSEVAGLQSLLLAFTGQGMPLSQQTSAPPAVQIQEADTQPDTLSAPVNLISLSERPKLTGRAAALLDYLEAGAELVDGGGMYRAEKDGQVLQSYSMTVGRKLLAIPDLLVQVAPGRWTAVPTLDSMTL